ncbi:MAG: hypothetical protein ABH834_07640 [Candidatus Altiarchaeota archaeon]
MRQRKVMGGQDQVSRRQFLIDAAAGAVAGAGAMHAVDRMLLKPDDKTVPVPVPAPDVVRAYVESFATKHSFDAGLLIGRCAEFGIPPLLVLAQINVESKFNARAENKSSGDKGFMQIREDKIGIFLDGVQRLLADSVSPNEETSGKASATLRLILPDEEERTGIEEAFKDVTDEIAVGKPPRLGEPGVNELGRRLVNRLVEAYDPFNTNLNIYVGVGYDGQMYGKFPEIFQHEERMKFMLASYCGGLGYVNAALRLAREKEGGDTDRLIEKNAASWWPAELHPPELFPPGTWQTWEYAHPFLKDERCFVKRGDKKIWPKAGEIIAYVGDVTAGYGEHLKAVAKLRDKK